MKYLLFVLLLIGFSHLHAQNYLGQRKTELMKLKGPCDIVGNYEKSLAFKCDNRKIVFYFSPIDSTCDLYAVDVESSTVNDTIQKLNRTGFKNTGTKYLEAFLVSRNPSHQKFPTQIYSNGKVQYCIMPVSLNGRSTEMNAVIIKYVKK